MVDSAFSIVFFRSLNFHMLAIFWSALCMVDQKFWRWWSILHGLRQLHLPCPYDHCVCMSSFTLGFVAVYHSLLLPMMYWYWSYFTMVNALQLIQGIMGDFSLEGKQHWNVKSKVVFVFKTHFFIYITRFPPSTIMFYFTTCVFYSMPSKH